MKMHFYLKNGHENDNPIPSRTVVSLTSASFAVENDLRNRNDAFLFNFYHLLHPTGGTLIIYISN